MTSIDIKDPDLIELLEELNNWFDSTDKSLFKFSGKPDHEDYYTSEEYFETINQEIHVGYPEVSYVVDYNDMKSTPLEWRDKIVGFSRKFKNILSSPAFAANLYYPSGGYMGWHNNHNASGYNILLSYAKNGDGFFRYKDPKTLQTITIEDKPRWTAKVGYYGSKDEKDKIYWHCARAYEDRLTLGFIIPNESMWKMMIDDIQAK